MDKILKHALDSDAVNFITEFKSKLSGALSAAKDTLRRNVAASMAGVDVVQEVADATARYSKKMKQLSYFNSRNTEVTVNADNVKKARAIIKASGVDQKLVVESEDGTIESVDLNEKKDRHVFFNFDKSTKLLKWRTSDGRTGADPLKKRPTEKDLKMKAEVMFDHKPFTMELRVD